MRCVGDDQQKTTLRVKRDSEAALRRDNTYAKALSIEAGVAVFQIPLLMLFHDFV
jgi:hypothetical protein